MKKTLTAISAAVILAVFFTATLSRAETKDQEKQSIEVAFVLDTTGSMSNLIEGAKLKIWSIANEIISAENTPELKVALIGYRDRGDAYVTKVYDLSTDLDNVYSRLKAFQAGGGGDGPESVNQAMFEAVNNLSWSEDREVLKIIFLVGDAPPHMDYQDDVKYSETCKRAVKKDLIINTIQCGNMGGTAPIWQEIARLSEGEYVQIGQTGDMVAVATPMDADLHRLNSELSDTAVAYGKPATRREVSSKMSYASSAPAEAVAERMGFLSKSKTVITGEGDLIADMETGTVNLDEVPEAELPEELKDKNADEREEYINDKTQKRKEVQAKIDNLLKKREDYIKAELAEKGKADAFDQNVADIIRRQGEKKGIIYK